MFLQHPAKPAGFGLLALSLSLIVAAQQSSQPSPTYKAAYQKWLDEDLRYLISDQERSEFSKLASDEKRDIFIEGFWRSHNPEPGSSRNLFKEEHYRRLAYVNSHYASSVPGYKTDRGRIYISYGPPSSVERHFSAAGSENLPHNDKGVRLLLTGNSGTIDISTASERM